MKRFVVLLLVLTLCACTAAQGRADMNIALAIVDGLCALRADFPTATAATVDPDGGVRLLVPDLDGGIRALVVQSRPIPLSSGSTQ